jgi:hypothetical protein
VEGLAELVRESVAMCGPGLELALFGTADAAIVARLLADHVAATIGPPARATSYRAGVGVVVGVALEDGSVVVVKVHRWNVSRRRLADVQRVQSWLADRSLPAPRPLGHVEALGHGFATIEEHRPGEDADGHDPTVRRSMAQMLDAFVTATRALDVEVDVGMPWPLRSERGPLWPEPHSVRFDFEATATGAGRIDHAARRAMEALATVPARRPIVAHLDWRTENLAFGGADVVAIYDWDALAHADEAVVVGMAAAQFCSNWRLGHPLPSIAEIVSFVDDYEAARGHPFDHDERARLDAANLWLIAYGARCQHSDQHLRPDLADTPDQGWLGLLDRRPASLWSSSRSTTLP